MKPVTIRHELVYWLPTVGIIFRSATSALFHLKPSTFPSPSTPAKWKCYLGRVRV